MANIWVYTGGFCKFELSILQVWTLILQVEFVISQLGGDSATWRWFATCFAATKHLAKFRKWISFRSCEMGFGLRNFRSTLCSCLQTAIISSFQLRFAHRLKHWTSDFPIFEKKYSMHKMDSSKHSKCVQKLLSSWILHVRFLFFSSLHSWLALAKDYETPKLGFFM